MKQLFEAVEFIHSQSVVHRDLKVRDIWNKIFLYGEGVEYAKLPFNGL